MQWFAEAWLSPSSVAGVCDPGSCDLKCDPVLAISTGLTEAGCNESLVQEYPALHNFMDERSEAVVLRSQFRDELLHDLAVGELNIRPGRVHQEFFRQVARELVLVRE